jgi:cytochrome P450
MPPCPPHNVGAVDYDEDVMTPANGAMEKVAPKPQASSSVFAKTFHWELNLYTFSTLGFVYYMLHEKYRVVMKVLFCLIAIDAARYYQMKGSIAGVPYTLPFVSLIAMLVAPIRFWTELADIAMASEDGMCTNTLVGKFLVFVTDPKICREVLTGEGVYDVYAHPNAKWLFGQDNLIYMDKEPHKAFRKVLSPALFSGDALEQYARCQESVVRRFLSKYAIQCKETNEPLDLRIAFRSMAAAASQESFLGPYLTDDLRVQLEQDILLFTLGFLCVPFPYLGTGLSKAIDAKNRIEDIVQKLVPKARKYVTDGNAPRCLLERWAVSIMEAAKEQGVDAQDVPNFADEDVGRTVLDFLFAAQDATNSALTYAADVLAAHSDVMDEMCDEVDSLLGKGAEGAWSKVHDVDSLSYTCKVANQILHHKPPVPMIPHLSKKPSTLKGHYIPSGAVLIPSLFYSARVSGSSTEFLPEREDADPQFVKCMTFGGGQHKCPGRRYAESLLAVFLAVVASNYRFERVGERPHEDDYIYFPTLFPARNDFLIKARD